MAERSWFYRKIGFWFVPVRAADLGPKEWGKIRRSARFGKSRRARRVIAVLWVGLLAFYAHLALIVAGGDRIGSVTALITVVAVLIFAWLGIRAMRLGMAQPSLEDRAVVEYGAEFDALKDRQRAELFEKQTRETIRGNVSVDERETDLRQRSEAMAYRILRPALAVVLAAWWSICIFAHGDEAVHATLTRNAIAITFLTIGVLGLPTGIRMWTQPDTPGDTALVTAAKDEA